MIINIEESNNEKIFTIRLKKNRYKPEIFKALVREGESFVNLDEAPESSWKMIEHEIREYFKDNQ